MPQDTATLILLRSLTEDVKAITKKMATKDDLEPIQTNIEKINTVVFTGNSHAPMLTRMDRVEQTLSAIHEGGCKYVIQEKKEVTKTKPPSWRDTWLWDLAKPVATAVVIWLLLTFIPELQYIVAIHPK